MCVVCVCVCCVVCVVLCYVVLCCVVLCCVVLCAVCGVWCVRAGRGKKRRVEEDRMLDARCNENIRSIYIPEEYVY